MTTIYFSVRDNRITLLSRDAIVAENYNNYQFDFAFDEGWEDLAKVVTLKTGSSDAVEILYSGPFAMPFEAASVGGMKVSVSGYLGSDPMTAARTAVMAHDVPVLPAGFAPELPAEYTPSILEQILAAIGDLTALDTQDKRSLVLAINETLADLAQAAADTLDAAKAYTDAAVDGVSEDAAAARQAAQEAAQSASAASASSAAAALSSSQAASSASGAALSATQAAQTLTRVRLFATQAEQQASQARSSANRADDAATAAEAAKNTILGMRAEASSLPAGSDATASYSDGVMSFGIPRGQKGDTGSAGPGVPAGGSSGNILMKTGSSDYQTGWTAFDALTTQEIEDIIDDATEADPGQPRHLDTLPAGGTTGQVLAKASDDNYDAEWVNPSGGGGGGTSDYTDLSNKPSINGVTLTGNKTATQLGLGTYSKPSGGIPASDLASAVQTSLGKADTAYQKPSGGIPAADLASGVIPTVPSAATANPENLGTKAVGTSTKYAREDHVHQMPSASDVGAVAAPSSPSAGDVLTYNGSAWGASAPAKEVFVCTYNSTTSAEIEAAYQAGKICVVTYNSKIFQLVYRGSATSHTFACFNDSSATTGQNVSCSSDSWTAATAHELLRAPSSPSVGDFLVYTANGWAAETLEVYNGGSY